MNNPLAPFYYDRAGYGSAQEDCAQIAEWQEMGASLRKAGVSGGSEVVGAAVSLGLFAAMDRTLVVSASGDPLLLFKVEGCGKQSNVSLLLVAGADGRCFSWEFIQDCPPCDFLHEMFHQYVLGPMALLAGAARKTCGATVERCNTGCRVEQALDIVWGAVRFDRPVEDRLTLGARLARNVSSYGAEISAYLRDRCGGDHCGTA